MAPVRRYLRITKYSVLECRIYVDNPALVQSWLLHPRDPVLPRVMESVRPLVLPKLMEERDRARKKGASKKKNKGAIRDVLVEKDFEVSLFLVETNTRHSLLYKHRHARDKTQTRLVSNSSKLTGGATTDAPIDVDVDADLGIELGDDRHGDRYDDRHENIVLTAEATGLPTAAGASAPPHLLVEDSDDDEQGSGRRALQAIPDVHEARPDGTGTQRRSKRRRNQSSPVHVDDSDDEDNGSLFGSDGGDNAAASDDDDDNGGLDLDADDARPPKKRTRVVPVGEGDDDEDEGGQKKKKKLAMDVIYEGFAIYGRVLCLVVRQLGAPPRGRSIRSMLPPTAATASNAATAPTAATQTPAKPEGHAAMENWIASTQIPLGDGADE